eukprot:6142664-Amphidinium_carterae.2
MPRHDWIIYHHLGRTTRKCVCVCGCRLRGAPTSWFAGGGTWPFFPREAANGYHIFPLTPEKTKEVFYAAMDNFFNHRDEHHRLVMNGMHCDFYWPKAIEEYEKHFDYTLWDPPLYKLQLPIYGTVPNDKMAKMDILAKTETRGNLRQA